MQMYQEGRGLTRGDVRYSEAPRPLRPQPVSLAQSCSALGRLGPLLMRPASQVLVIAPTGHPFGDSKAKLLWQWHLEGQGMPCPGEPWGTWQLVGELPSPSPTQSAPEPVSSHSPWGSMAPHLTLAAVTHPSPQSLGTLSPSLPALHLFTESPGPSRPPHSTPHHRQRPPPPTHADLSLFTLPLTPQPSDVTHLPIKPVDFGVVCSVSGALCICCPSNGGVPSADPLLPLPVLSTQGPTCPSTAPLSALYRVPGPSWGGSSPPHPPLHSPLSAKASWFHLPVS